MVWHKEKHSKAAILDFAESGIDGWLESRKPVVIYKLVESMKEMVHPLIANENFISVVSKSINNVYSFN